MTGLRYLCSLKEPLESFFKVRTELLNLQDPWAVTRTKPPGTPGAPVSWTSRQALLAAQSFWDSIKALSLNSWMTAAQIEHEDSIPIVSNVVNAAGEVRTGTAVVTMWGQHMYKRWWLFHMPFRGIFICHCDCFVSGARRCHQAAHISVELAKPIFNRLLSLLETLESCKMLQGTRQQYERWTSFR